MRLTACCLAWGFGWIVLAGCQSQPGIPNHETRPDAETAAPRRLRQKELRR